VCGKGLGSKHVMCVDDCVQCVGGDWEVCMLCVWMIVYSVWEGTGE